MNRNECQQCLALERLLTSCNFLLGTFWISRVVICMVIFCLFLMPVEEKKKRKKAKQKHCQQCSWSRAVCYPAAMQMRSEERKANKSVNWYILSVKGLRDYLEELECHHWIAGTHCTSLKCIWMGMLAVILYRLMATISLAVERRPSCRGPGIRSDLIDRRWSRRTSVMGKFNSLSRKKAVCSKKTLIKVTRAAKSHKRSTQLECILNLVM